MTEINYQHDVTGSDQRVKGSDGRLNTSSRSDGRAYYNSRDSGQSFSIVYNHPASAAGQYSLYFKNNSTTKDFVIEHVGINSDLGIAAKLWFVTGTAGDGAVLTPVNMNKNSNKDADSTVLHDGGGTTISGLTTDGLIDHVNVDIQGHEEFRLADTLRLGQGDAIAIEVDSVLSSTPLVFGVLFGYFE